MLIDLTTGEGLALLRAALAYGFQAPELEPATAKLRHALRAANVSPLAMPGRPHDR